MCGEFPCAERLLKKLGDLVRGGCEDVVGDRDLRVLDPGPGRARLGGQGIQGSSERGVHNLGESFLKRVSVGEISCMI